MLLGRARVKLFFFSFRHSLLGFCVQDLGGTEKRGIAFLFGEGPERQRTQAASASRNLGHGSGYH